jgi:hypothetical protein
MKAAILLKTRDRVSRDEVPTSDLSVAKLPIIWKAAFPGTAARLAKHPRRWGRKGNESRQVVENTLVGMET